MSGAGRGRSQRRGRKGSCAVAVKHPSLQLEVELEGPIRAAREPGNITERPMEVGERNFMQSREVIDCRLKSFGIDFRYAVFSHGIKDLVLNSL